MENDVRHRLFIALEVCEPARAALAKGVEPLRMAYPWLRWTDPETWHVTLAFVGRVSEPQAVEVDEVTAETVAGRPPLRVRIDGRAGTFSGAVFFASITEEPALIELAAELTARLHKAGLPVEERDFIPHCTLAQVPRGTRLPSRLLGGYVGPAVTWTARRVVVVRSRLRIGGIAHETRSAHPFTGDPR